MDQCEERCLSASDTRSIMRLAWSVTELRTVYPNFTARQMLTFLAVASNPGLGPTEYARVLGTIQPIASRWLLDLGPHGRDAPGLQLLERRQDPRSLRQVQYHLTAEGLALAEKLAGIINGRGPSVPVVHPPQLSET